MIVYIDASALVKRYIKESGSPEVNDLFAEAASMLTNLISRAEVSAAIMRAARTGIIEQDAAERVLQKFRSEWENYQRLPVTEATVARANAIVSEYDLRGYDAVHLAAAMLWQEAIGIPVTLATFDSKLWEAAQQAGLDVWPNKP